MRVSRSSSAFATSLLAWLVPLVSSISVPTGKLTPITPARPTPRTVNPHAPVQPAPVVEYTQDHPEPPPLDPSYVPVTYNYFNTLARHHILYVPMRFRNFNAPSNSIEYDQPEKFFGHTLGKNIGYKPYKQQLTAPYGSWNSQYHIQQNIPQYNSQNNEHNDQQNTIDYNQQNDGQYTNDHYKNVQLSQQHQQQKYEAMSTQSPGQQSIATSVQPLSRVDYNTGKGSYDVTGKGGSKSEYYGLVTKDDWSKKSAYPKKVLDQGRTLRKYDSHKY